MSKWIRNQTSEVEREKVTFYVTAEADPHIIDWIHSIPYGKTGEHIRAAIDFYLEHGQAVMPDKTSSRRKQSARRAPSSTPVDAVRKTAPAPSPTLRAVDSVQKTPEAAVDYRELVNLEAPSEPISSLACAPVQTPSSIPDPVPAPIPTPALTPAVNSALLQSPALEPKKNASDSVLDSEEQEANSLDDIDPQTLALQMELANRFSF